jgi:hypothetical protein
MEKTNTNLVEWCKKHLGDYYWFGCWAQMCSKKLYESKKAQYPKYYTAKDFASQIANPKPCMDCAGLIKGFCWAKDMSDTNPKYNAKTDYGATAFYDNAKEKGKISSFPRHAGMLVFKGTDKSKSHVGVYIGTEGGTEYVIEAKGHKYGVVKTKFSTADWKYWAQSNLITDDTQNPQPAPQPAPAPEPQPAPQPTADKYKVTTKTGASLALRKSTKTSSALVCWMPNGSEITVDGFATGQSVYGSNQWAHATYKGKSGYCTATRITKI